MNYFKENKQQRFGDITLHKENNRDTPEYFLKKWSDGNNYLILD